MHIKPSHAAYLNSLFWVSMIMMMMMMKMMVIVIIIITEYLSGITLPHRVVLLLTRSCNQNGTDKKREQNLKL